MSEPDQNDEDGGATSANGTDEQPLPVRTAVAATELGYSPHQLVRMAHRHECIKAAVDWKLPGGHYRWNLDRLRTVLPPKHSTDTPDD